MSGRLSPCSWCLSSRGPFFGNAPTKQTPTRPPTQRENATALLLLSLSFSLLGLKHQHGASREGRLEGLERGDLDGVGVGDDLKADAAVPAPKLFPAEDQAHAREALPSLVPAAA